LARDVFEQIKDLVTEQRNPNTVDIDSRSTPEILRLINQEDKRVAFMVEEQLPQIAKAVDLIVESLKNGGRLFYIGAGTSGRLGVLDAAECPPTFGTDPAMIQGVIAGGKETLIRSREGVEDNHQAGAEDLKKRGIKAKDVVVGIAASRRTPYVLGGLEYAKRMQAKTIFIFCNPTSDLTVKPDVVISPVLGPEVIAGSTRMKAGTAQKLILNMLTTAAMIKLGKVYQNLMVDLKATSQKLAERSKRIIMLLTGADYLQAEEYLKKADHDVKTALIMIIAKVKQSKARRSLKAADGSVRKALELISKGAS